MDRPILDFFFKNKVFLMSYVVNLMYKALNSYVLLFVDHDNFADPSSEGQPLLVVQPEIERDLYSSIHKIILSIF